jgi:hypothetical protein
MVKGPTKTRKLKKTKSRLPKDKTTGHIYPGPSQCHPRVGDKMPSWGCFPPSMLKKVLKEDEGHVGGGTKDLLQRVAKHLGVENPEGNQRTLLQAMPFTEEEKTKFASQYLRPAQPVGWKEDPDMWLDSNNIRDVMRQYEESRPDFKFLGPYPIDFASPDPYSKGKGGGDRCYIGEMCSLNLKQEQAAGKKYIGIVYNLDPHYKGGSHWVANFIDIPKKHCYYFDSYGMKPPKQVNKFMQWLTLQEPTMQLGMNGRQFQRQDTECGVYCLYFLDRMLAGEPYLKFVRSSPSDKFMLDLRDWFYST